MFVCCEQALPTELMFRLISPSGCSTTQWLSPRIEASRLARELVSCDPINTTVAKRQIMKHRLHLSYCRHMFFDYTEIFFPVAVKAQTIIVHGWGSLKPVFPDGLQLILSSLEIDAVYTSIPLENCNAAVEELLIFATDVDVVGLMAASTARCPAARWIEPLADDARMVQAAEQHYPRLRETIHYWGNLVGLGLRAVVCNMPAVDMDEYQSMGLTRSDFPVGWHGCYDQIVDAADRRAPFFLPHRY